MTEQQILEKLIETIEGLQMAAEAYSDPAITERLTLLQGLHADIVMAKGSLRDVAITEAIVVLGLGE